MPKWLLLLGRARRYVRAGHPAADEDTHADAHSIGGTRDADSDLPAWFQAQRWAVHQREPWRWLRHRCGSCPRLRRGGNVHSTPGRGVDGGTQAAQAQVSTE